jgi:hypothetical protein
VRGRAARLGAVGLRQAAALRLPRQDARELATTVISALEGAEVTAQVARDEEALQAVGRQLARLVRSYEVPPPGGH